MSKALFGSEKLSELSANTKLNDTVSADVDALIVQSARKNGKIHGRSDAKHAKR